MIDVGYGNYINDNKVLTVVEYSNSKPWPVQRAIKDAKSGGLLIDVTMGKVTKSNYVGMGCLGREQIRRHANSGNEGIYGRQDRPDYLRCQDSHDKRAGGAGRRE